MYMYTIYTYIHTYVYTHDRAQKLRSTAKTRGPGRYREVREAYRIHFHLISSRFDLMARSYDQRTKKVNEYSINDY